MCELSKVVLWVCLGSKTEDEGIQADEIPFVLELKSHVASTASKSGLVSFSVESHEYRGYKSAIHDAETVTHFCSMSDFELQCAGMEVDHLCALKKEFSEAGSHFKYGVGTFERWQDSVRASVAAPRGHHFFSSRPQVPFLPRSKL